MTAAMAPSMEPKPKPRLRVLPLSPDRQILVVDRWTRAWHRMPLDLGVPILVFGTEVDIEVIS